MTPQGKQKLFLFHDLRHIRCGDLEWLSPSGENVPLNRPPESLRKARALRVCLPQGIRLAAQKASKSAPLPAHVRLGHVVHEEGIYRSWYLDVKYPPGKDMGCYSDSPALGAEVCSVESRNGVDWSAPVASPVRMGGQTGADGFTVFRDPGAPPAERYKGVYMAVPPRREWAGLWKEYERLHPHYRDHRLASNYLSCMYGLVSPDGVHWTAIRKPLMVHKSDTDTTVYYDDDLRKYVMYTRLYRQERRWVGRAETADFRHWEGVAPLLWPSLDPPYSDDIYTNCRTTYPGLPDQHLMFPMFYHREDQSSEVRMYSSADGICWAAVPGGPVIPHGARGDWDAKFIYAGNDLVPWGSDQVALLYRGTAYPHKYPRWKHVREANRIGWVHWPKGRLCAVVADKEGEFCTPPLSPAGKSLRLNVRTERGGWVRVGVLPRRGKRDSTVCAPSECNRDVGVARCALEECVPISGDGLALPVRWRTEGTFHPGAQVSLHFRMNKAKIFGFEWFG